MLISGPVLTSMLARTCKSRRQAIRLRQADLAAQCGVAEATLMRFERTGRINLEIFTRIAVALGLGEVLAEALQKTVPARPPARTAEEFLRCDKPRQRVRLPKASK